MISERKDISYFLLCDDIRCFDPNASHFRAKIRTKNTQYYSAIVIT